MREETGKGRYDLLDAVGLSLLDMPSALDLNVKVDQLVTN